MKKVESEHQQARGDPFSVAGVGGTETAGQKSRTASESASQKKLNNGMHSFELEAAGLATLHQELEHQASKRVLTGIGFIDDFLNGLHIHDVLVLGASTGVGKTGLAIEIAKSGAQRGARTKLFALEAEDKEVLKREYYSAFARICRAAGEDISALDYVGWYDREWEDLEDKYRDQVESLVRKELAGLEVLYKRSGEFTLNSLRQSLESLRGEADLVVLDHLHMVDSESQRDLETQNRVISALRDMALDMGIPVVAVSHLRKKHAFAGKRLVPDISELHGSSELSKKGTHVMMLARAWDVEPRQPWLSPTFIQVPKDRRGRDTRLVACLNYDRRTNTYEPGYTLGRIVADGGVSTWKLLAPDQLPHWARRESRRGDGAPF